MLNQKLPHEWIRLHGSDLPSRCELQIPMGRRNYVGFTRIDRVSYFDRDWGLFVLNTRIQLTDTLIFFYHGDGAFKVIRFDEDGCMPDRDVYGNNFSVLGSSIIISIIFFNIINNYY